MAEAPGAGSAGGQQETRDGPHLRPSFLLSERPPVAGGDGTDAGCQADTPPGCGQQVFRRSESRRALTLLQAGQRITADHLRPLFLNRPSRSVPNGIVIGTSPAGQTVVAAGTAVQVFVSAGQPRVPVPDLTGEDVGTARDTLTHAGLHPRVRTDSTSTAPANAVTRQAPPAATRVPPAAPSPSGSLLAAPEQRAPGCGTSSIRPGRPRSS